MFKNKQDEICGFILKNWRHTDMEYLMNNRFFFTESMAHILLLLLHNIYKTLYNTHMSTTQSVVHINNISLALI